MSSLSFLNKNHQYGFTMPLLFTDPQHMYTQGVEFILSYPVMAAQTMIPREEQEARSPIKPVSCKNLDDLLEAKRLLGISGVYLVFHTCLRYNLAGSVNHQKDRYFQTALNTTCIGLTSELDIAAGLGIGGVVHIGSCKNKKAGIFTIAKIIERVLTKNTVMGGKMSQKLGITQKEFNASRKIILENAAGEGNKIGYCLEEIRDILTLISDKLKPQVKICIDTAHAFGAGIYDWGKPSEVTRFYNDFDSMIGLEYLEVFHLNDSMRGMTKRYDGFFGSRKDCHENLGLGHIFGSESRLEGLKEFLVQARKRKIPVVGEPPRLGRDRELGLGGMFDLKMVQMLLADTDVSLTE